MRRRVTIAHRRDSFLWKKVRLQQLETIWNPLFADDIAHRFAKSGIQESLQWFSGVCRVVKGMRNLRVGGLALGRRHSTPCATVKRFWKRKIALPWKRWIFLK